MKNTLFAEIFESITDVAGSFIGDVRDVTFNLASNVIEDGTEFTSNVVLEVGKSGAKLIDCTGDAVSEILGMLGDRLGVNWDTTPNLSPTLISEPTDKIDDITEEEFLNSIDQLLEDYDEAQEFVADEAIYGKRIKNKKFGVRRSRRTSSSSRTIMSGTPRGASLDANPSDASDP